MIDSNTAVVLVAIIGVVVPLITLWINTAHDRRLERKADERAAAITRAATAAAVEVETVRTDLIAQGAAVSCKLDGIHSLVNSQLTDAVNRFREALAVIEDLKQLLYHIAPNDTRVQALMKPSESPPQREGTP